MVIDSYHSVKHPFCQWPISGEGDWDTIQVGERARTPAEAAWLSCVPTSALELELYPLSRSFLSLLDFNPDPREPWGSAVYPTGLNGMEGLAGELQHEGSAVRPLDGVMVMFQVSMTSSRY